MCTLSWSQVNTTQPLRLRLLLGGHHETMWALTEDFSTVTEMNCHARTAQLNVPYGAKNIYVPGSLFKT